MPNTFAPRALATVVKDRTDRLRFKHDGADGDVKEWHAMVDLLADGPTEDFVDVYSQADDIPEVVDLNGALDGEE